MNLQQSKALKLIAHFNPNSIKNGAAFTNIKITEFLDSLKQLVANPRSITQGIHPLCGIACAVKIAAELDPVNLVKMSTYFYANGEYVSKSFLNKPIKVANKLKTTTPIAGLSPANHVIQTTVKAFYNPITGYNNRPGTKYNEWQGITFPIQLKRFLKNYFNIEVVPTKTFRHTVEDIQSLLAQGTQVLAWTSWNQMIKPGGKLKLLEQHYVIIKSVKQVGETVELIADNPRRKDDKLQKFVFDTPKNFYKAIIGIYAFKARG